MILHIGKLTAADMTEMEPFTPGIESTINHPFVHELGLPVATAGMGYPDTRAHAPNENIRIDLYLKHARHMVRVVDGFGNW